MIEMNQLIQNMRERPEFEEFKEYVITQVELLNSVEGLADMSNEAAGETAKVRLLAAETLYKILSPFIHFKEKKQYTPEDYRQAAAKRAL